MKILQHFGKKPYITLCFAVGVSFCVFYFTAKQPAQLSTPIPLHYDESLTPWLFKPLDAQVISKHYTYTSSPAIAVAAWPLLSTFCAPTIYADWETLGPEEKIGSVQRQKLCIKTFNARSIRDLNGVISEAQNLISTGQRSAERSGRYKAALGFHDEDFERLENSLKTTPSIKFSEEQATNWILQEAQLRNSFQLISWSRGTTIGPYTPTTPWQRESNLSPEEAMEKMRDIIRRRGLIGLRLPLGVAQTPNDWVSIVERMDKTALLIEKRSQMGAGSFGLWGRIFLDWRNSDRNEANALTLKIGDFYFIQSQEKSLAHEWFHAYSHWSSSEGNEKLQQTLLNDIRRTTYTRKQMHEIFRQSRFVLSKEQIAQQWMNALKNVGSENAWDTKIQHAHQNKPVSVFWYAQAAWTTSPKLKPDETPWIARRRAVDEMLSMSGWQGRGIVKPGYYTEDKELMAAAFQGDMNIEMFNATLIDSPLPSDLVVNPLPVESKAMRWAFTRMFRAQKNLTPPDGWTYADGSTAKMRSAKD